MMIVSTGKFNRMQDACISQRTWTSVVVIQDLKEKSDEINQI